MRVLIVNLHSLLMDGVESLLEANGHFEVVSTPANNLADLTQDIKHSKPNIVIIDEAVTFIKPAHLITSLPYTPKMRLIVLNSRQQDGCLRQKEFTVSTPAHFIEAINNETPC